jgi:hypothetical protein
MAPAGFHRAFVRALLHSWWALASAISTVLSLVTLFLPTSFLVLPASLKRWIAWGLAVIFLITLYRAAWSLYEQGEKEKQNLRDEITKLKRRPYDEAHRRLVEGKLSSLKAIDRDLLRFLLHRGLVDDVAMRVSCIKGDHACQLAANTLHSEGLISASHEKSSASYPRGRVWWAINPQFVEVLQDLLYSGSDSEGETHFRT